MMCLALLVLLGAVAPAAAGVGVSATASQAVPPTIVHIVADDLGWNDLGYTNGGKTHTPHINTAVQKGIELKSYYTYKVCSPSRASIMTGRYPWGVGYYDMIGTEAVPLHFDMLPAALKKHAGYETHAIGKWNLGHHTKQYTPTFRGFDSFLGYYMAALPDYWYHGSTQGCCSSNGGFCTDLSNSSGAMKADGVKGASNALNGTYDSEIFTSEAVRLIHDHATRMTKSQKALYLYVAFQSVHACSSTNLELQAPCDVIDEHYSHVQSDSYKAMGGMLTMLDFGVGNITAALNAVGHPYVLIFHSDNGGPPLEGATNAPLRYGKHTLWEGGIRVRSFVTGPLIPERRRGKKFAGLAHSSDWYLTIIEGIAKVSLSKADIMATGRPRAPDGVNLWPVLLSGKPGNASITYFPRWEVIHQVVNHYSKTKTKDPAAMTRIHQRPGSTAMTQYKLVLGEPGPSSKHNKIVEWPPSLPHPVPYGKSKGTRNMYPEEVHSKVGKCRSPAIDKSEQFFDPKAPQCKNGCLFDILADPSETKNLIKEASLQKVVSDFTKRLNDAAATGPPWAEPFSDTLWRNLSKEICKTEATTGYLEPVLTSAPPSPPPHSLETALVV